MSKKIKNKTELICLTIVIAILLILLAICINAIDKNIGTIQNPQYQEAKEKLEKAVSDSYNNDDVLDVSEVKRNIKEYVPDSKIVNEEAQEFPISTVINGYEFKVEENGNINDIEPVGEPTSEPTEEETKAPTNDINKNVVNTTVGDTTAKAEKPDDTSKIIVKYNDDTKTAEGITITTTKDGTVTVNGKARSNLFIKISNGIEITKDIKDFITWLEKDGMLIEKGKKVKQKVDILSEASTKGQLNVVLRTEGNEAFGILKLLEKQTEFKGILEKNIIANYVYIDDGVEVDEFKFKVQVTEEKEQEKIKAENTPNANETESTNTSTIN